MDSSRRRRECNFHRRTFSNLQTTLLNTICLINYYELASLLLDIYYAAQC